MVLNILFCLLMCLWPVGKVPQLGKAPLSDVVKAMTLEEKVLLLVGASQVKEDLRVAIGETEKIVPGAAGTTCPIPRLGIPAMVLADGPAGLRINPYRKGSKQTYYCTAFPIATMLASTWNTELVEQVGTAMGNEVLEYGCDILLAPAMNIHRNPLCGRNFEYYSEDPYVAGKVAAAMVKGIQSNGVGTSVKHFAVNNQETNRIANNSILSERALREIYLKGFEMVVKEAQPWTIMSSYNLVNGVYTSESKKLLTDILRKEWGYDGVVVTDWFGGRDAVAQVKAGNDLLMPGKIMQQEAICKAVKEGKLSMADVDRNVENILRLILKTPRFKKYRYSDSPDLKNHATLVRQAATEGIVLLKNNDRTLPFTEATDNIALFGNTSYQFYSGGTGSGDVQEAYTVSLLEGLKKAGFSVDEEIQKEYNSYLQIQDRLRDSLKHIHLVSSRIVENTLSKTMLEKTAKEKELAIITIGRNSGEYKDRKLEGDFELGEDERLLIDNVSQAFHQEGKRVVVILNVGGVIETASWKDKVDAILLAWQGGQEGGNAVVDVMCGNANPSGRLTMTFPIHYQDAWSARNFPILTDNQAFHIYREFYTGAQGVNRRNIDYTLYDEDVFVGYRYFDTEGIETSFPFGYGLSYTDFDYSGLKLKEEHDGYTITCKVRNTGKTAGKEVVQFYFSAPGKTMDKPEKELKAFAKTTLLQPGQSETVSVHVTKQELASYSNRNNRWEIEEGSYKVMVGKSVEDVMLKKTIQIKNN